MWNACGEHGEAACGSMNMVRLHVEQPIHALHPSNVLQGFTRLMRGILSVLLGCLNIRFLTIV